MVCFYAKKLSYAMQRGHQHCASTAYKYWEPRVVYIWAAKFKNTSLHSGLWGREWKILKFELVPPIDPKF